MFSRLQEVNKKKTLEMEMKMILLKKKVQGCITLKG